MGFTNPAPAGLHHECFRLLPAGEQMDMKRMAMLSFGYVHRHPVHGAAVK